jgi:hypothetical protein
VIYQLGFAPVFLDFVIDDNPLKQNQYTPGLNIPITPISKLDEIQEPICFVPLAWNFFNEIVKRIKDRRVDSRDRYITYFPKVEAKE